LTLYYTNVPTLTTFTNEDEILINVSMSVKVTTLGSL